VPHSKYQTGHSYFAGGQNLTKSAWQDDVFARTSRPSLGNSEWGLIAQIWALKIRPKNVAGILAQSCAAGLSK
jgi:hypothetical protein